MSDLYAVIGNPVEHSKSPQIHAEFARQFNEKIEYIRVLAPRDGFGETVQALRARGALGANVTLPFKEEAYALVATLSPRAKLAGAVNTLKFDDGMLGENTDGIGLVRDIENNLGVAIADRRVLVLGAGGAARGILGALAERQPRVLALVNRDREKAQRVALAHASVVHIAIFAYPDLHTEYDIIINATASSIQRERPPVPATIFANGALAYDLMYAAEPTPFMQFAKEAGAARVADGVGMLVEQAAESYFIWRGKRPRTAPVIALLR